MGDEGCGVVRRQFDVLGDKKRLSRDALRVTLDRQTWFELYSLANGADVP